MCHWLRREGKFWGALRSADERIAEETRALGCRRCGGPLHRADYPRKPRGIPGEVEEAYSRRRSFCCGHCRRRATPPSVRFLGRKVYVGERVIAASVAWDEQLAAGVPRRTVRRWLVWWRKVVPATDFWQTMRALFRRPVAEAQLPRALVERYGIPGSDSFECVLRFVSPLSTESASYVRVDVLHAEDGGL